jgi:sterol 24-C-methyltransferase
VYFLETVGIAPKGSMGVSGFLKKGADGLVAGGKEGLYTVMYFTVAKKPLK